MNPQSTITVLRGLREREGRKVMGKSSSRGRIRELPHARHSDLFTSTGVPTPLNMGASCATSGCSGPSVVTLGKRDYCREHFIQTCYEHLEVYAENFKERDQADELACDTPTPSMHEIVNQSTNPTLIGRHLR